MAHGIEAFVKLAPAVWPGEPLDAQPGDLDLFAPMGNGLRAPRDMMPWDSPRSVALREAYYGFHQHSGHPFSGAPVTEAAVGTIYFDGHCRRADVDAMLRLMNVRAGLTDYAAFVHNATAPGDRYLTQLRLVSGCALEFLSDTPDGAALRVQPRPLGETVWEFTEWSRTETAAGRQPVNGALGGDGDWASESLAFGFMVENSYNAVYRVWTRAWLVTK